MDVILESKDLLLSEFGLCGKELACHTCKVNFIKGSHLLADPSVEEEDVFDMLGKDYIEGVTRMAC